MPGFSDGLATKLHSYVYLLRHPDPPGRVFYIGRGRGDRVFQHLRDTSDHPRAKVIADLRAAGKEPVLELLRSNLTEREAQLVEASCIDLLGIGQGRLTNLVRGDHKGSFGLVNVETLIETEKAKRVKVIHPALLIRINQLFRDDMTEIELYEATRGVWKLGPKRQDAVFAMAVYRGLVKEVYQIKQWHPAGTTAYKTRAKKDVSCDDRVEFTGTRAPDEIRRRYLGRSVKGHIRKGNRSPCIYVLPGPKG